MSSWYFLQPDHFPIAGHRQLRPVRPLFISVPVENEPLEVNLGTPFNATALPDTFFRSPRPTIVRSSIHRSFGRSPLVSRFFDDSEDSDCEDTEEEDTAQYIDLSSDSPFFAAPPGEPRFGLHECENMYFSCGFLEDDIDSAADVFHNELESRMPPSSLDDTKYSAVLTELDSDLVSSPTRVLEGVFLDLLKHRINSGLPPYVAPENIPQEDEEDDESDDEGELYFSEDSDSDKEQEHPLSSSRRLFGSKSKIFQFFGRKPQ